MKIMKKKLLALGLACAALFAGHDAKATDLEITAQATIAQPITLTKDTDNTWGTTNGNLSFGVITPGDTVGSVEIIPTGGGSMAFEVSKSEGLSIGGNYGPAYFKIHGSSDTVCSINFPDTDVILYNESDPTKHLSMRVSCPYNNVTLNIAGNWALCMGGILLVPADATTGSYTGTFTVSVDYQ